jgi:hypothetical protein
MAAARNTFLQLLAAAIAIGMTVRTEAAESNRYLPADTQLVIFINVKQILASPIIKPDRGRLRQEIKSHVEWHKAMQALGVDPFRDLIGVTVAMPAILEFDRSLLILHGRFDAATLQARADQLARDQPDLVKSLNSLDRKFYMMHLPGQRPLYLAPLENGIVALAASQDVLTKTLGVLSGRKQQKITSELQKLLAGTDQTASVSVAGLGTALKGFAAGNQVQHLTGEIQLGDEIRVEMKLVAGTAESAKRLAQQLNEWAEQFKSMVTVSGADQKPMTALAEILDQFKMAEQGDAVIIKGQVTRELLEQASKKPEK